MPTMVRKVHLIGHFAGQLDVKTKFQLDEALPKHEIFRSSIYLEVPSSHLTCENLRAFQRTKALVLVNKSAQGQL